MAIFDISGFQEGGTRQTLPPIGQHSVYIEDSSVITKKATNFMGNQAQEVWLVTFKDKRGETFSDYFEVYHANEMRRKMQRNKFLALCKALKCDPDMVGDAINLSEYKGQKVTMHVDFWFPAKGGSRRHVTDYTHGS